MSRRTILAISAAVSAFVLVLAGAAASFAWRPAPQPSAAQDVIPADVVRAREASYQRLLEEANTRLRVQQAAAPPTISDPAGTPSAVVAEDREERNERGRDHHERTPRHHEEDDDG